jgi:hypothetical protein
MILIFFCILDALFNSFFIMHDKNNPKSLRIHQDLQDACKG